MNILSFATGSVLFDQENELGYKTINQTFLFRGDVGGVGDAKDTAAAAVTNTNNSGTDFGRIIVTGDRTEQIPFSNGTFGAITSVLWTADEGAAATSGVGTDGTAGIQVMAAAAVPGDGEYIFDRLDVRIIFITLYSLVFACCFFGECFYSVSK